MLLNEKRAAFQHVCHLHCIDAIFRKLLSLQCDPLHCNIWEIGLRTITKQSGKKASLKVMTKSMLLVLGVHHSYAPTYLLFTLVLPPKLAFKNKLTSEDKTYELYTRTCANGSRQIE
eukprot:3862442-Ditylum_brightwellii.AAC.1